MTKTTEPNPASILARLRNLCRTDHPNLPANLMLLLYAQQGLLARLEISPHAEDFVLKGALSLFARFGNAARPTEEIDLAASRLPNTSRKSFVPCAPHRSPTGCTSPSKRTASAPSIST